jgi:ligand-binding sensor domain-containing protein
LFNAQNGLVIAQANAQWRQNLATFNTAAQNESNMQFAQTMNELTAANMDRIWQRERDLMSYAVQTANNNADRANAILLQKLANDAALSEQDAQKSAALLEIGGAIARDVVGGFLDDIF